MTLRRIHPAPLTFNVRPYGVDRLLTKNHSGGLALLGNGGPNNGRRLPKTSAAVARSPAAERDPERAMQLIRYAMQFAFAADILEPDNPADRQQTENKGR